MNERCKHRERKRDKERERERDRQSKRERECVGERERKIVRQSESERVGRHNTIMHLCNVQHYIKIKKTKSKISVS